MPVYRYKCVNPMCPNHFEFEITASMNDNPLQNCPRCACEVNRVFRGTKVNLNFEGSYNSTRSK